MDCAEITTRLSDLVAGKLPPTEREAVQEHLRHCAACSAAAVSRVHAGDERALWEHAGRTLAKRVIVTRPEDASAEPPFAAVLLRRAPKKSQAVLQPAPRAAKSGPGLAVRLLQGTAVAQAVVLAAVLLSMSGDWRAFLGLERWNLPARAAAPVSPPPPAAFSAEDIEDSLNVLRAVAQGEQSPAQLSEAIAARELPRRLYVRRTQDGAPEWARPHLARLEAFLLRVQAAGAPPVRPEEWRDLRRLLLQEDLIASCADLPEGLRMADGKGGP